MATVKIDPLTADNYDTWKIHMTAILKKNDLWEYVTGAIRKPTTSDPVKSAEWTKLDGKAESDIMLAISSSELRPYANLGSSKAIWDKLKTNFESRGATRKSTLLKRCITAKMNEGDDLREHIADFCETAEKLSDADIKIPDQMLVMLLLGSLPESCVVFKENIESRDELPKLDALIVKLYDRRERQMADPSSPQGAMYSRKPNITSRSHNFLKEGKQDQLHKRKIKCHRCGKDGYIARECRTKLPGHHKQKFSANKTESKAANNEGSSTCLNIAAKAVYNKVSDEWCIDSGCTSHMCNNREAFENYKHANSEVALATNSSTQITGTGDVRLIVDNNGDHEIKFENVLHVSDLRTNLLSVVEATDRGFVVTFQKNDALVTKDNKVFVRADRREDLYYVRKSKNCVKKVEVKNKLDIMLWHERLGHLNEGDIKEMIKTGLVHSLKINITEKLPECEVCISEKQTQLPFAKK